MELRCGGESRGMLLRVRFALVVAGLLVLVFLLLLLLAIAVFFTDLLAINLKK